jgi:phage-related protein
MAPAKRFREKTDSAAGGPPPIRRRWRDYRTASGRSPVEKFIEELSDSNAAAVLAGMEEVRDRGLRAARHLDGDIWEVRVDGDRVIYRILFAEEGSRGQILLALDGFNKKTQKTPRLRSSSRRDVLRIGGGVGIRSALRAAGARCISERCYSYLSKEIPL